MSDFQQQPSLDVIDPVIDMIRSEERASVELTLRETGRVRISKRVVTEEQTITVTVRREVLVVEEAPAHEAPLDVGVPSAPAQWEHRAPALELVLHEEQVRTTTVVVPVERVKIIVESVDGAREITTDLAHEVVTYETSPVAMTSAEV